MRIKSKRQDCKQDRQDNDSADIGPIRKKKDKNKDKQSKITTFLSEVLGIKSKQKNSGGRRNYIVHQWKKGEFVKELVKATGIILILSYFFYRSIWSMIPMSAIGILYVKKRAEELARQGRRFLNMQFKECILSVAASLRAGYAVENAFLESKRDMELLYGDTSFICKELEVVGRGLVMNVTLEELLWDFGIRSGCHEIREFAEVFAIAKRSGGNLAQVIQSCTEVIGQRVEAEEEILLMVSSRRMEQNIMNIMPFGILMYVEFSNRGYFDGLYHNMFGIGIMSGCLMVYLAAFKLAEHILGQTTALG